MKHPDLDWRHHTSPNGWFGTAAYDKALNYRYFVSYLARAGGAATMTWIMLNPSTATHDRMDPTLRRCWAFARAWGYAGMSILNLYALRSTDPRELTRTSDPIGPDNDQVIDTHLASQHRLHGPDHLVVCGWGGGAPRSSDRPRQVWDRLTAAGHTLSSLGTTAGGQPRHPLYLHHELTPRVPDLPPPTYKTMATARQMVRDAARLA